MKKVVSLAVIVLLTLPALGQAREKWSDGLYVGGGVGGGRINAQLDTLGLEVLAPPAGTGETLESNTYNNTSLGYKFFAGYRFFDYFALEGGFVRFEDSDERLCFIDDATGECATSRFTDPGELDAPTADTSIVSDSQWEVTLPFEGWDLFAVGIFPISERFEFFGKVGAIAWKMQGTARERVVGGLIPTGPPNDNQVGFPPGPDSCLGGTPPYPCNDQRWIGPGQANTDDTGVGGAAGLGFTFLSETNISVRTELEYFDVKNTDDVWLASLSAIYSF